MGEKCIDFEMEGVRPKGRPKKTPCEVTEKIVRPGKYRERCYGPREMENIKVKMSCNGYKDRV